MDKYVQLKSRLKSDREKAFARNTQKSKERKISKKKLNPTAFKTVSSQNKTKVGLKDNAEKNIVSITPLQSEDTISKNFGDSILENRDVAKGPEITFNLTPKRSSIRVNKRKMLGNPLELDQSTDFSREADDTVLKTNNQTTSFSDRKRKKRKLTNEQKELNRKRVQKCREKMSDERKEREKLKDKERYQRKKALQIIKPVSEMTVREKRIKRKQWRMNSKKYYQKKKILSKKLKENHQSLVSPQMKRAQKNKRKKEACIYRENSKLKAEVQKLKTKLKTCQRREERQKQKAVQSPTTPNSKVNHMVRGQNVSPQVRKKLVFGEALTQQLERKMIESKNDTRTQQLLHKIVAGKILKKYRIQNLALSFLSYKMNKKYKTSDMLQYTRKRKCNSIDVSENNRLRKFFERDDNSRMCPGKRECLTRNKVRKQKRLLLDTVTNLHQKFILETGSKISFISFWRNKPFWIVTPKQSDRDTCMCQKHSNIDFIFKKLKYVKVFDYISVNDLIQDTVCDPENKDCMSNMCSKCRPKQKFVLPDPISDHEVEYFQFELVQEQRVIKGTEKKIKLMKKVKKMCLVSELIQKFNDSIIIFKRHVFDMRHQSKTLIEVKSNLQDDEIMLQVDFSMNYVCKLSSEVQSMHFGASKKQLSLHTVVLHAKINNLPVVKSYCTVSDILDHNAHGVWAHMSLLLSDINTEMPQIKKIHIFSDGPSAQYRNRSNIYLLFNIVPEIMPNIEVITWNYTEAGHGKGPMDGVGAYVKRTADVHVLHGNDISCASDFVGIFKEKKSSVKVFEIKSLTFSALKDRLEKLSTQAIPSIMSLHQILWKKNAPTKVYLRNLSCFLCDSECNHNPLKNQVFTVYPEVKSSTSKKTKVSETAEIMHNLPKSNSGRSFDEKRLKLQKDSWVAVIFDDLWYPGQVLKELDNDEIEVCFMERKGAYFYWPAEPLKPYKHTMKQRDILCVINTPPVPTMAQCSRSVLYCVKDADIITEHMQSSF